jgi:hypothetical protein
MNKKRFAAGGKRFAAGAALVLMTASGAAGRARVQAGEVPAPTESPTTTGNHFQCNPGALSSSERAHHKHMTDKLIAGRNAIVETPTGYEFQFSPSTITLAELAEWAAVERKCCPFFDFHIDLEKGGSLLCLRLTGAEGINQIIRGEFQVPGK